MKTNKQRINNIIGQLQAIAGKIETESDYHSVLSQMKAARSALDSAMTGYIQEHLWEVLDKCSNSTKSEQCKKFLNEIVKIS